MSGMYLIWSNEHRAWWGPNRCGYFTSIDSAGRYLRDEAIKIASSARGGWAKGKNPDEIAMPEADALEQSQSPLRVEAWVDPRADWLRDMDEDLQSFMDRDRE
jgi:hypothetical protein